MLSTPFFMANFKMAKGVSDFRTLVYGFKTLFLIIFLIAPSPYKLVAFQTMKMTQQYDLSNKVALITGANSGIGKVTARTLAQLGATVVISGRNREKVEDAAKEIQSQTGNQKVDYLLADLSRQADIKTLANSFLSKYDQLHILINNAGLILSNR